jgi:hypothetical protein
LIVMGANGLVADAAAQAVVVLIKVIPSITCS